MMASFIATIDLCAALAQAGRNEAPGREGVDARDWFAILRARPRGRVGIFTPRRRGEGVGASLTLAGKRAGGFACGFPVLSRAFQGANGLAQGRARPIVGKPFGHFCFALAQANRLMPPLDIFHVDPAAVAADCHGAPGRSAAP